MSSSELIDNTEYKLDNLRLYKSYWEKYIIFQKLNEKQDKKKQIRINITNLTKKINEEQKKLFEMEKELSIFCKKNIGQKWIREKENCLYGETYHYCKICGKDKYSHCIYTV